MSNKRMTEEGFRSAAADLGTDVATVKAVAEVESAGRGFLPSGKPKILFEGHLFHRLTKGKYTATHPTISYPKWTKRHYLGGEAEYRRLDEAMQLDPVAAMKSASWGAFQILGDNFKHCGFATVEDFVEAMRESEDRQLQVFVDYVQDVHLDDELQRHDWRAFARGYNGPLYERNQYDTRLATAYKKHLRQAAKFSPGLDHESSVLEDGAESAESRVNEPAMPQNTAGNGESKQSQQTVVVEQQKPQQVDQSATPGIKGSLVGIVTFLSTTGSAFLAAIFKAPGNIVVALLVAAAIVGAVWLVVRFWFANKDAQRKQDAQEAENKRAHEITLAKIKSAQNPDTPTVEVLET